MDAQNQMVERLVGRLKSNPLGDLITEEDLRAIVREAIPRTFFESRVVKETSRGWSSDTVTKPPLIIEIVQDLLKEQVRLEVDKWLKENHELCLSYWKKVLDEGLLKYVQAMQNAEATRHLRGTLDLMVKAMNEERAKNNLPLIAAPYFY